MARTIATADGAIEGFRAELVHGDDDAPLEDIWPMTGPVFESVEQMIGASSALGLVLPPEAAIVETAQLAVTFSQQLITGLRDLRDAGSTDEAFHLVVTEGEGIAALLHVLVEQARSFATTGVLQARAEQH